MPVLRRIKGRYELLDQLGEGGMGVVYSANDLRLKRKVALKTIRSASDRSALELFERECEVLIQLSHPNIVEIFDIGEFEEDGLEKPYFVMPLLEGQTLDFLIRDGGLRLMISRAAELIAQACRGLQAAHERGLIHRDLKPSNIFVLQDDSVKVIDFGIAHMTSRASTTGRKGTPFYMSPEQIEMKTITPLSDQFTLGVLCYETMTGRRPFDGGTDRKLAQAILREIPPAACDLNPAVNRVTSQVIAKSMAKKPYHRFASVKEFASALQKAVNGEQVVIFEPSAIAARVARAQRAFEAGDMSFASELVDDLQSEGYVDEAVLALRRQVEESQLQSTIRTLLARAYSHLREDEHALALQKVQDILDLDPNHSEAVALKQEIEDKRTERRVEDWLHLATRHVDAHDFAHASEALINVLELRPGEVRARSMLAEVQRRQREDLKVKHEKEALYQDALRAWHNGEITTALGKLERILHMDGSVPGDALGEALYQELYNTVCSERDAMDNAIAEARKYLAEGNFSESLAVCDRFLEKHPRHPRLQALRIDIEDNRRQQISELIAETNRRVTAEPDLDRRVRYLEEACSKHPEEPHFQQALKALQERRELVRSIVTKARLQEEREQFAEALDQWQILRSVHPQHPGVDIEMERVRRRREQQMRNQVKSQWVERIDREIERGQLSAALTTLGEAQQEFPNDPELAEMEKLARLTDERLQESRLLHAEGSALCSAGQSEHGLALLRRGYELNSRDPEILSTLLQFLLQSGYKSLQTNVEAAESVAQQALDLDPRNASAKSLITLAQDRKREQFVDDCMRRGRALQAAGDLRGAETVVAEGLSRYPAEPRLRQFEGTLRRALADGTDPAPTEHYNQPEPPAAAEERPPKPRIPPSSGAPRRLQSFVAPMPNLRLHDRLRQLTRHYSGAEWIASLQKLPRWTLVVPGLVVGIALVAGSFKHESAKEVRERSQPSSVNPVLVPVDIRSQPSGANVRINGRAQGRTNLNLNLEPGAYDIEVELAGHRPAIQKLTVASGQPVNLDVPLVTISQGNLQIFGDLAGSQLSLDGNPATPLTSSTFTVSDVSVGSHTVVLRSHPGEATFTFEVLDGGDARLQDVNANGLEALLVRTKAGETQVLSSRTGLPVVIDGDKSVTTGPRGVRLPLLRSGEHRIAWGGESEPDFPLSVENQPILTAYVHRAQQSTGSLLLVTGEEGAQVTIDGKPVEVQWQNGQSEVKGLRARKYQVQVAKAGFETAEARDVRIEPGRKATVNLRLQRLTGLVELSGGTPGATVTMDGSPSGVLNAEGSLELRSVAAGTHTLELRKEKYKAKQVSISVGPQARVTLSGNELKLVAIETPATLQLQVEPGQAVARLKRGDAPAQNISAGQPVPVAAGEYTLIAEATGFKTHTEVIRLADGESRKLSIKLQSVPASPHQLSPASDWEKTSLWSKFGDFDIIEGGDLVFLKANPVVGVLSFFARLQKGKRLQWVGGYKDAKHYALFQMDRKYFQRTEIVDGKQVATTKTPHGLTFDDGVDFQIEIRDGSIIHWIQSHGQWKEIDRWTNASAGRFGLLVPGKDRVAIARARLQRS